MRKTAALGALLLLVAFLVLRLFQDRSQPKEPVEPVPLDSASRDRVSRFWSSFQTATRLRTSGDFYRAAEAYRDALKLDPNHQESLYYLGNCLSETGDYEAARTNYERLLELQPDSSRGWSTLGLLLSSPFPGNHIDLDRARRAFENVAAINPEQSGPFLRLGSLALQQGDLEEALRQFQTASGFRSPNGLFLSGLVLYRLGRFAEASSQFERVLEIEKRENQIAGRGASSEGDVRPSESPRRSPLQIAAFKSRILLSWSQSALGKGEPTSRHIDAQQLSVWRSRVKELARIGTVPGQAPIWKSFGGLEVLDRMARAPMPISLPDGIQFPGKAVALAREDYDGDGLEDVFVVGWKSAGMLFKNLSGGRYQDVTESVGLAGVGVSSLAVLFFDYDQDSRPDLLLTSQAEYADALEYLSDPTVVAEQGTPRLFRNDIEGFVEVTAQSNLNHSQATVQAFAVDLNDDSWMDLILISGSLGPEVLLPSTVLLNRQGRFEEYAWVPGLSISAPVQAAAVGDLDADGKIEVYLAGIGLYRVQ